MVLAFFGRELPESDLAVLLGTDEEGTAFPASGALHLSDSMSQ
jgi:hypothetical protein